MSAGINILPYINILNFSGDFKFQKTANQYYVIFKDWSEFARFFQDRRDIDKKFIEEILSGETDEENYSRGYHDDMNLGNTYWPDSFLNRIKPDLCNFLKTLLEKSHPEVEKYTNFKDLFKYILKLNEDGQLDVDIEEAFNRTISEVQEMSDYDEAYKDIMNAVTSFFGISDAKWLNDEFKAKITEKGLNELLGLLFNSEIVEGIDYKPPYYGYQGDIEKHPETFSEILFDKLENI